MTGGLMQLVAYGAQDIYLTGNPMITYFKVVYRRHTNFAMESIEQTFSGTAEFGNKVSCLISRNGDLVSGLTLQATLPANGVGDRWTENVGHYLIKEVSVEIGGQQIDKHYSDWLEIWSQLTVPASKRIGYQTMIGQGPLDTIGQPTNGQRLGFDQALEVYIPLQFWFCRNVGLALPLIALQYHEVKVNIEFETRPRLSMDNANPAVRDTVTTGLTNVGLWADYIYLDTDERRRFAQVSHEYLIEQLQFSGDLSTTSNTENSFRLHFNHPVKELIWVTREVASEDGNQWCNYTSSQADNSAVEINGFIGVDMLAQPAASTLLVTGAGNGAAPGIDINADTAVNAYVDTTATITGVRVDGTEWLLANENTVLGTAEDPVRLTNASTTVEPISFPGITTQKMFQTGGRIPGTLGINPTASAKLKLNGHDRFASRNSNYFNLEQTCKHHTSTPISPGINVYSFALKPEDHQPSGTCNFSRIDNAQLLVTTTAATATGSNTKIFAVNYNVLRIMSGMGGLAYSN